MTITKNLVFLSEEEKSVLAEADWILAKIKAGFSEKDYAESLDTGEVVDMKELPRVRGILGGLSNSIAWEIHTMR